ncbi:MAG: type II toxin-antitoxin system RelE/ParE family toxin [bacterium]
MSYKISLAKSAAKDYNDLHEPIKSQINEVINKLEQFGTDAPNIKPLTGQLKGYFRIRSGDYRIVFFLGKEAITIVSILHRKEVYKKK